MFSLHLLLLIVLLFFTCFAHGQTVPTTRPGGVELLPGGIEALELRGNTADGRRELVPVEGQPFVQAIRAATSKTQIDPWDLQLGASTAAAVEKGDVILASFFLRNLESMTGSAVTEFCFERAGQPHTKSITQALSAGPDWQRIDLPFIAAETYAPGEAQILFRMGYHAPQAFELAGVHIINYGKNININDLPRTRFWYDGHEPDAPWRKLAQQRIDQHRKAGLTVIVTDPDGKPIPGAKVHVRMKRHAFPFGSAVAADQLLSESEDGERYRRTITDLFNKVVLENDLKWYRWRHQREQSLAGLKWLREQGLPVRGHTLVWPSWRNSPTEWESLQKDPEALRRAVRDHITDEASSLRRQVVEWDVINEPYANDQIMEILGNDVMVEWFQIARDADPNVKLYINDYGILSAGGRDRRHQDHYHQAIKTLIEKGAPIQGIGMQGHFGSHLTPPRRLWEILDRFAELGLEIQITEFDINITDETIQEAYMRDFLTAMFAHPAVNGVLMWGFWEGRHWLPNAALFRRDWSLKPNGQAWLDLVKKQWWTDEHGTTDADGSFRTRGFLGEYDVEVSTGGEVVRQPVKLELRGAEVRVTP